LQSFADKEAISATSGQEKKMKNGWKLLFLNSEEKWDVIE
jgi:uncharacterized protein YrzB (UPF0473 family)